MRAPITLTFERRPSALAYMLRGAWPRARGSDLEPAITARWEGHRVDPRELAAFRQTTGLREEPTLPLLYPHVFGFRLAMAVLTHPAFPVPIWGVLQTRNHLLQHRAIPDTARLGFETSVGAARVLEKGLEIDLHTTVRHDEELAFESVVTFYARGRFGAPGRLSALARGPSEVGPVVAEWTMPDAGHLRFGGFTGDYNGIHLWNWYARRFGFSSALYHPPRVLGQCLARLPAIDAERPQRLDAWLKGPVPHGAAVRLHAAPSAEATRFALYAAGDRPSIVGTLGPVATSSRLIDGDGAPIEPSPEMPT